jgi:hypothetical protein
MFQYVQEEKHFRIQIYGFMEILSE